MQLPSQRNKGEGVLLMPPKSEKSRRTIELRASCVTTLRDHAQPPQKGKRLARTRLSETGYVFTSTIGTPIDDRKILK
jgi:hypothetical protein